MAVFCSSNDKTYLRTRVDSPPETLRKTNLDNGLNPTNVYYKLLICMPNPGIESEQRLGDLTYWPHIIPMLLSEEKWK